MGLCFSNSVIERGSLAHAELPSPRYMYGSPEVNNLKKGRNNIKSSTLTAPAHLNDKKKELTSSSSVFDLFGLDSSTVLEETKNASVLGTLKSPPTQACEVLGMRWGIYGEKGTVRESMEDRTLVQKKVSSGEVGSSWLFGVLDGHNGTKAVEFVERNFYEKLFQHPQVLDNSESAFYDAFHATDSDLLKHLEKNVKSENDIDGSGTTALFVLAAGSRLFVAHVGDSVAIMSEKGKAKTLCEPHKPDSAKERRRIEEAGGAVVGSRIYGTLGVSRSFGDYHFKASRTNNKMNFARDVVSSVPDVIEVKVSALQEFLVITSDGLTSVMTPQIIVNFIKDRLVLHSNVQLAAEELVKKATVDYRCADNVSVVILVFHQWGRPLFSGRYSAQINKAGGIIPTLSSSSSTENLIERTYSTKDLEDYIIQERRAGIRDAMVSTRNSANVVQSIYGPALGLSTSETFLKLPHAYSATPNVNMLGRPLENPL